MHTIEQYPTAEPLRVSPERLAELEGWLVEEVEDALGARTQQDGLWRDLLRMYEGVPRNPTRNTPIENAPNIEVTLGAIHTDSIYSQSIDLIFTVTPLITVRATNSRYTQHAKAVQRFANYVAENESGIRAAAEHAILDDCQLGTGVLYVPFVEQVQKRHSYRVTRKGPRIYSVPPEDVLLPGGSYADLQMSAWVGLRFWRTQSQLNELATYRHWDIDHAAPVASKDWVRSRRESLGRTVSNATRLADLYETFDLYVYYDIDGDGFDEDLLIHWDRTSKKIMRVRYNPYEHRPLEAMRYQIRAHLFSGIGIMEMCRQYQEELTELHNYQLANVMIANMRLWKSKTGTVPEVTLTIWPGRNIEIPNPDDLKGEQLGDVYPSLAATQGMVMGLAERRTGVDDRGTPRPSQIVGSRTPATSALAFLQQFNRRFTAAFDGMRLASAGAVRQCLFRYQERVLDGDEDILAHITRVLGEEDGRLVLEVLNDQDFHESLAVELTASSASVNRDADRQNSVMLVSLLATYYQRTLELVAIAANPQTPPQVVEVAKKIATSAGEIIERTIRTFDQIRDPETFIVDISNELDQAGAGLDQEGLGLLQSLLTAGSQPAGAGLPPGTA